MVASFDLTFGGNDFSSFRNKETDNLDGLVDQATSVASKVDDKSLNTIGLYHSVECCEKLLRGVGSEFVEEDITNRIVQYGSTTDSRQMYVAARYLLGNQLAIAFEYDLNSSSRFTTQVVGYLFGIFALAVKTIYLDKSVARQQTCQLSRHALVELVDVNIAISVHDERSNTTIFALGKAAEFVVLAFGDIEGVWINLVEHIVDAGFDEVVVVERIHIVDIQLAHDIGING